MSKNYKFRFEKFLDTYGCWIITGLAIICFILMRLLKIEYCFRLDQYASTIFGTIISIIGTMFGLTAASYAFIWGELKSEGESNHKLKHILEEYRSSLWNLFFNTLILSLIIVIFNLLFLGVVQHITDPTLSYLDMDKEENIIINIYYNEKYTVITLLVLIDLGLSVLDILLMGGLNYFVFSRKISYGIIANEKLEKIRKNYNLDLPENFSQKTKNSKKAFKADNSEFNKIHYLELLVNRIMNNHDNEGEVYSSNYREERLLEQIVYLKLENCRHNWEYMLNEPKRENIVQKISDKTAGELNLISRGDPDFKKPSPVDVSFTAVYNDLILYRDTKMFINNELSRESNVDGTLLKCTIKKRLLLLLMSNEKFDGMDLANMSLSGADLSYSNFSNCNLKGVRMMGTNCKGADFSGARMPGIHFVDKGIDIPDNIQKDDIKITCMDDGEYTWNIYGGCQATCLEEATFANADISRMTLLVPSEVDYQSRFPLRENSVPVKKGFEPFSMRETNFDKAKLFYSKFKHVDISNSSISQAQMFNSNLTLVNSENSNFSGTVMTRASIKYSRFVNVNFREAVMSDCNIFRSDFQYANLSNTNYSNSKITSCNFQDTICNNTSFKNLTYDEKNMISGCDCISFKSATLREADFSNAELYESNFTSANVLSCNFTGTKIHNSTFKLTVLTSTIWNSATVNNSDFIKAIMRDCVFINGVFNNCRFENCDFSNSVVNCRFSGGMMSNIKFCDVKELNPKSFENIYLNSVDFTGSSVRKSAFSTNVVLINCKFDEEERNGCNC